MAGGRRTSLASLAGARVETVPGRTDLTLVSLPLARVVPTPLNPRTNFGTPDELTELGESMLKRQLQPVVVVSRASYLKLFPEHTERVGAAAYVIITGERRYRGARQVGLETLGAIIMEEIATSRHDVLDAVLSENIDRKNFDPIEEALAVQLMVKECGKAVVAAQRFRRTGGWISQRLSLLRLAAEVQVLVRSGQIPVREARELATHPENEQMAVWRQRLREREQARDARAAEGAGAPSAAPPSAAPEPGAQDPPAPRAAPVPAQPGRGEEIEQAPQDREVPAGGGAPPWRGREPDWAQAFGEVRAAGRALVERFTTVERRRLVSYLMTVEEQESPPDAGDAAGETAQGLSPDRV